MRLQEQGKTEQARKDLGNILVTCKNYPLQIIMFLLHESGTHTIECKIDDIDLKKPCKKERVFSTCSNIITSLFSLSSSNILLF